MKKLIITEKPNVAMDFVKAFDGFERKNGYYENDEYIVSWTIGHFVTLYEPEDYNSDLKKWSLDTLPIIPEKFQYKPIKKTKKQLNVLQKLINRKDVEYIINAGDAGREGELIQRLVYQFAGNKKPVKRFWTSLSLTPKVVKKEIENLKDSSEFDNLFWSGKTRQIADWLIGINLTRALSVKIGSNGKPFSVGRVQTAVLGLIYERDMLIKNFEPEIYFQLKVKLSNQDNNVTAVYFEKRDNKEVTQFFEKEKGEAFLKAIEGDFLAEKQVYIKDLVEKDVKQQPPLLYNLTELQREANKLFGYSAKKTLDIAQSLYEKHKVLSYPRTESKYIGENNFKLVENIYNYFKNDFKDWEQYADLSKLSPDNKRVFDSTKLTDHHALIPLKRPKEKLTPDEKNIFMLVMSRFFAVFSRDYKAKTTTVYFALRNIDNRQLKASGTNVIDIGWKGIYTGNKEEKEKEETFYNIKQGDVFNIDKTDIVKGQTKPPAHYTESSLLKDMTDPAKYIEDEQLRKIFKGDVGLGTQATRAEIIETIVKREYVKREKKSFKITDKGIFLVETLKRDNLLAKLLSAKTTAEWEMALNSLTRDKIMELYNGIVDFVKQAVNQIRSMEMEQNSNFNNTGERKILGKCPKCGNNVYTGKKAYYCSNRECDFAIFINGLDRFGKKKITEREAEELLRGDKISVRLYSKAKKKKYKAIAYLEKFDNGKYYPKIFWDNGK